MEKNCAALVEHQKEFFASGRTRNVSFRKKTLKKLLKEIQKREKDIHQALYNDFRKSTYEAAMTETGVVLTELRLFLKKMNSWSQPKRKFPSLLNFPSTAKIYAQPYGTTLIISPWNYPYQLAIAPLIGAVAAGNTVILKPSELTSHTSKILEEIISAVFDENHVAVVQGGVETSQELLAQRWDYIFFTGSVKVGKIVAKAAAPHLTPVTLELGGKNPCIVDYKANLTLAAKRIVWGKFLNAGQTCIAPDYIIVQARAKFEFVKALKNEIVNAYGENPKDSPDYPRIINQKNYKRLVALLYNESALHGGNVDANELYIAPTLLDEPSLESEVMEDEIFGPILPILVYDDIHEISEIISRYEKPLSLYVFSNDRNFAKRMITEHSFGGGAINDTIVHFVNHRLPFGGVGNSGIGAYHGKHSFDTFSHQKSVVDKKNWLDLPIRYAPYKGKLKKLKFFQRYF